MRIGNLCWAFLITGISAVCLATVGQAPARVDGGQAPLPEREQHLWSSAVHDSEFSALPRTTGRNSCEVSQPPQALATPDPLLEEAEQNSKVRVSFIIGTDGRVHSALILESAGDYEDRTVLNTVRIWRYRPALCNGIPTDSEAKVEFSSH
ncbi:MAG: energy transducer TonB [Terriglobales bacterium]|nr:energy transducer TonB [Terriglobales bacterium]